MCTKQLELGKYVEKSSMRYHRAFAYHVFRVLSGKDMFNDLINFCRIF